jgi:uncharacterized membrane protein YsdA (DUF1294 family)/cold shock CspA family protein
MRPGRPPGKHSLLLCDRTEQLGVEFGAGRGEHGGMESGHITEWNRERGFGYVESDGRRIFLHRRDFAEKHKAPEAGDHVRFVLGTDQQGRPCAQQAVHVNDGGSFRVQHLLVLLLLLLAPGRALWVLSGTVPFRYLAGYVAVIAGLTYAAYAWDKHRARTKGWREPESLLHLLELLGGWPGAFVAQCRLRHKRTKVRFQIVFWLIVALHQFAAVDYLRGWPVLRLAVQGTTDFPAGK